MSFRNPLKQAKGLGSAHEGLHHWVVQRYTAVALIFLGLWFVYFVIGLIHADYLAATDAIARPWNATLMVAFLIATFWHAQLGLQVILEDYVHTPLTAFVSQLLVRFVCFLGALASVFAVVRIALGN
ncbi:MAG: succinate dehydrogenase, hydrophobic membrane anchor protein [Pseudoxanthomonas spadix]|nr:MAG: succinate dehydrogenase, hydrophobic membrane anchor protein [Pseudoxanthomonas spadix]